MFAERINLDESLIANIAAGVVFGLVLFGCLCVLFLLVLAVLGGISQELKRLYEDKFIRFGLLLAGFMLLVLFGISLGFHKI